MAKMATHRSFRPIPRSIARSSSSKFEGTKRCPIEMPSHSKHDDNLYARRNLPRANALPSRLAFVAFLLLVSGCGMHWHSLGDPTESDPLPSPLRVTTISGRHVVIYEAAIADGKIRGLRTNPYDSVKPRRVSVPLDSVASVEYGEAKVGDRIAVGSGYVIAGATLIVLGLLAVVAISGPWGPID